MAKEIDNIPIVRLPKWRRGNVITAKKLKQISSSGDRIIRGVRPAQQIHEAAPIDISQYKFKEDKGDFIIGQRFDGAEEEDVEVEIAKPFLLRQTVFEEDGRNDLTFTYTDPTATTEIERTANDGTDTEDQVIVPEYVFDDIIYVMSGVIGTLLTIKDNNGDTREIRHLDMNVDGRAWAKKSE